MARVTARDTLVDIFDEVDEDLRAERAKVLLRRYGSLLAAAGLLVIAGVAAWQSWEWWVSRRDREAAAAYLGAMYIADQSRPGEGDGRARASQTFAAIARDAPDRYATMARLRAAALMADAGDLAGAAAVWDGVAGSKGTDPLLRDLANLSSAQRQLESGDPALLQARLKPLSDGGAWRALALETQALLQIRTGQVDHAKEILRQLTRDPTVPEGVRDRAGGLLIRFQG